MLFSCVSVHAEWSGWNQGCRMMYTQHWHDIDTVRHQGVNSTSARAVPGSELSLSFTRLRCDKEATSHRIHVCYIYGNIYHQYTPNVSIYTIHGSYGLCKDLRITGPKNWMDFTRLEFAEKSQCSPLRCNHLAVQSTFSTCSWFLE